MKTARADAGATDGQPNAKKSRSGVGSSVAPLVRHQTDDFMILLSKTKVERLLPKGREIQACRRNTTLPVAFDMMIEKNVLSLPVLTLEGTYFGFFDCLDIVSHLLNTFGDLTNTTMVDIEQLFVSEDKFKKAEVGHVMESPLKKSNPYHPIHTGFSLFTAWEMLALADVHRVPVVDSEEKVVDIITQSMLIDFLWQNLETIGEAADIRVHDIGSVQTPLVVTANSKAVVAFDLMIEKKVSGLAVVDENGRLVDNISLRDLKAIRPDAAVFWRLWNNVLEFKERIRAEFPHHHVPKEPLVVTEEDTLYQIVELMATHHVHRVFVVDSRDSMRPQRVIAQTDVLRELLRGKGQVSDKGKDE